jgi:hypothetical protein
VAVRILQGLLRARGEAAYPYAPGAPGGKRLMLGIENGQDRTAGSTSIEREVGVYILFSNRIPQTYVSHKRSHNIKTSCRERISIFVPRAMLTFYSVVSPFNQR